MKPAVFDYACPASIAEAIALLAGTDGAKLLAGGQSLMPLLAFRLAAPSLLVDLRKIPGLDRIEIAADAVRLGAKVRWCDIERDRALATAQPLLAAALGHVAHYQIRNRGTVGGSLAHADPAAELPGIAVACDAVLTLVGAAGTRTVKAAEFFLGPLETVLGADELIVMLQLPPWPPARRWGFEEFARRRGDFALAGIAAFFDLDDGGRIVAAHVGAIGVGPRPVRLAPVEALLDGNRLDDALIAAAGRAASASVEPFDDLHGSAAYRRALVGTLTERALARAAAAR
jgi:aerobic carbon-monoxide dehydrogenase medium subunit